MNKLMEAARAIDTDSKFINFILMNKDVEVLRFRYVYEDGDYYFEELAAYGILPISFEDINSWISTRRSPMSRRRLSRELSKNLTDLEYLQTTHAVSLNDTFWVKEEKSDLTWSRVSPYTNQITDIQSHEMCLGDNVSPEFSTNGVFPKCWINKSDGIYLIKGGSIENNYIEPLLEIASSEVYNSLCSDSVTYSIYNGCSTITDKSLLFTDENIGMISLAQYVRRTKMYLREIKEFMSNYSAESVELLRSMLVSDMVTMNTDRHLGNIGLYIENDTQKVIGMSKIYDYNKCLIPELTEDAYKDKSYYKKYITNQIPRIGNSFLDVAVSVIDSTIRYKLITLRHNFMLRGLSEDSWRGEQIKKFVLGNIDLLLSKSN